MSAIVLALLFFVAVPTKAQGRTDDVVYPGIVWEYIGRDSRALETQGWSPRGLRDASAYVRDSSNTTGLVVIHRGRMVFRFGDIEELSYIASARKSVLAMLYGRYVEDGTIDLDKTLFELGIDDVGGLLESERQATVRDLVTARSGVYHPASNGGDNLADAPPRGSQSPGTYMLYSNWDFNAAGAIFEKQTGVDIYDALQEQLAGPLRFQDWDRARQRKSGDLDVSRNPAYHMWISTRDMARIGYLMLHEGRWEGEQVVPANWARQIVSVVTPLEEMNPASRRERYFGYGYMWWVWDGPRAVGPFAGAYTARGAWGQWITVMPAVDLVIAHKTNSVYRRTTTWRSWQRFMELLLESKDGVEQNAEYPWN